MLSVQFCLYRENTCVVFMAILSIDVEAVQCSSVTVNIRCVPVVSFGSEQLCLIVIIKHAVCVLVWCLSDLSQLYLLRYFSSFDTIFLYFYSCRQLIISVDR